MNDFLNNIIKTKLSTMIMLGVMYFIGIFLTTTTADILNTTGVVGIIILCSASVLSIIAFLDYRHKEITDAAISQMEVVVASLAKVLEANANTSIASEKVKEEEIKSQLLK